MAGRGAAWMRKLEISNVENTPGTAEAAVEFLKGMRATDFEVDRQREFIEYDRASVVSFVSGEEVELAHSVPLRIEGTPPFRQMVWPLQNVIRGNVTPTQPSTLQPNTYLWTFEPSLTALNTPDQTNGIDTFTLEYGETGVQAYEASYLIGLRLTVSGNSQGRVTMSWDAVGDAQDDVSFTGSTEPTDNGDGSSAMQWPTFQRTKFYMDTTWAGLGGTQKTGVLRAFTWTYESMFVVSWEADGQLNFTGIDEGKKAPTLQLTYVWDTAFSDGEKTKWEDQTTVFPRLRIEGPTELDSAQSNPPYLQIDGAYQYTAWPEYTETNGILTVQPTLTGVYDPTGAKMVSVALQNALSAYPA